MVTGISRGTIARALELLDLDTADLAKAVGCTTGTLNRWRRGVQDPSGRYLADGAALMTPAWRRERGG